MSQPTTEKNHTTHNAGAPIRILVTAAGAPGNATLIHHLQLNGFHVTAADAHPHTAWTGSRTPTNTDTDFHVIPRAGLPHYIPALVGLCQQQGIDVLWPTSSAEIEVCSQAEALFISKANTRVLASPAEAIAASSNKYHLYSRASAAGVPCPRNMLVHTWGEFQQATRRLGGHTQAAVCFKPPVSRGSRGFRILDTRPPTARIHDLLREKPAVSSRYIDMSEMRRLFQGDDGDGELPEPLLVMECVEGRAYDCMTLCLRGEPLLTTVKSRERERDGIITQGALVKRPRLVGACGRLVRELRLSYNISIQFIGGTLVEVNPRTSTYIYGPGGFEEPIWALRLLLGQMGPEDFAGAQSDVPIGRRFVRYFDQVEYPGEEKR